jgi:predicted MPP superfamily phosphohydrolase
MVTLAGAEAAPRSYTGVAVTENFDALGAGTVVTPLNGWDAGQFNPVQANQPGPGNAVTTVTDSTLVVDNGAIFLANGTLSIGNVGTTGSADRALGSMPKTASGDRYYQLAIKNDTANPISSFVLTYTGEQWANAPSANPDSLTVWFSDNNAASGFVTMGTAFTFTAPKTSTTGTILDGNLAANRAVISATFTPAAPIAPGNTFYLRWYDRNDPIQDHLLAIDDLSVAPAGSVAPVAPTVSITSPADQAEVGSSFSIDATAADADGTVTSVAFYDGQALLGTDTTSPYSLAVTNASAGNHTLTAVATDNDGVSATSAAITVSVPQSEIPTVLLSQNFTTDPVNYTLPAGSEFRFDIATLVRYWAKSDTAGLTVNPGITGNAGAYLATQNIDGGSVAFSSTNPAKIDFSVAASGYTTLNLSIALAGMPAAEASNFIRAKVDTNGDGTYETTIFDFKGDANSAYTDTTLGALTSAFTTFPTIPLPLPTAPDGLLRLRLESFNDTDSANEATGIDSIVISAGSTPVSGSGPLARGPYLQKAAPTQMTVRWRGGQLIAGRVRYGTSVDDLSNMVDEAVVPGAPYDHAVTLTGLTPATTYYYSVGSAIDTLAAGADFTFTTPPVAGTVKNTRIWALGDAGTATANQINVRNAFYTWTGTRTPDLVLQLGDNAYDNGSDSDFTAGMFNIYPTMLRKTPFWSCLGNHETYSGSPAPYFDIYSFPTAAESGGTASSTESYYSFDYGNIHFISLDSMLTDRTPTGTMATWLQNDLASTTATWIVCFFHHPPYSKGSHNSDTESQLIQMRSNFLPILEAGGVDLVLCGHSHSYERSFLLDGHYGLSGTLTAAMKKNSGSGRPSGTGAYLKPLTGPRDNFGAVYAVPGSAGKISGGTLDHPAHFISLNNLGSLVIDINGTRLDATFLRENGTTADTFTIIKSGAADSDADGIPDAYEMTHSLNRKDPADAALDNDSDGVSNLKEWVLDTSPNAGDSFAFSTSHDPLTQSNAVTFPTAMERNYRVMFSDDLLDWLPASEVIPGTGSPVTWTDLEVPGKRFYRVVVVTVP